MRRRLPRASSERHILHRLVTFFATGDAVVSNNLVLDLVYCASSAAPREKARLFVRRSTLGSWSVVAYGMRQRTRELSIHRALGALSGAVVRLAVAGAVRQVGVALLVGLPAAWLPARRAARVDPGLALRGE